MKNKPSKRIMAALLAAVMVFLMIPFSSIIVSAAGLTMIEDYADLDLLGKGYNLLGDEPLSQGAVIGTSLIFNSSVVNYVSSTIGTDPELSFGYQYNKDLASYMNESSSKLTAEIGADAKIKMVSLKAKFNMDLQTNSSSSSQTDKEYAVLSATKKIATYRMDLHGAVLRAVWNEKAINAAFEENARGIGNTITAKDFFATYGTHILTGYSKGGEAVVTYSTDSLSAAFSESSSEQYSGELSVGVSKLVDIEGKINSTGSSNGTGSSSSTNVSIFGKAYGADKALLDSFNNGGFSKEAVESFFGSVTDSTCVILPDEKVQFLPIWELLMTSGDEELMKAGAALQAYFEATVALQCSEFYADYIGGEYVSDEEMLAWTNYSDLKIITTADELNDIRNNPYGNYVLACNIDLSNYENWIPIGTLEQPFMGRLFGNYNTVSGLLVTESTNGYAGLFGYSAGMINNLRVRGSITVTPSPDTYIGAIAAYNTGTVTNCYDDVTYDVTYSSVSDLNFPIESQSVVSNKTYFIDDDELGIHLVGQADSTYSNVNIVVEESKNVGPVYIILEDVNLVGNSSNGTIFNPTNRPLYIISAGTSNTIKGANGAAALAGAPAINAPNCSVFIFGEAELNVYGGNGGNGIDGGYDGVSGGNAGNGIIATIVYATINKFSVAGGHGGIGGSGGNLSGDGGNGGHGGAGGTAISCSVITLSSEFVTLTGGRGGDGGAAGNDTSWIKPKDGIGGNGGNGGFAVSTSAITHIFSSKALLIGGNGGFGGSGQDNGWWGASGTNASPKADIYIENKRYTLCDTSKTWTDAKASAEGCGGYLATITSEEEQAIINELPQYGTLGYYHIGAYRAQNTANKWAWITGEAFDFSAWYPGEPNNNDLVNAYAGVSTLCLTWIDYPNDLHGYIVEYDAVENSDILKSSILSGITCGYSNTSIAAINQSTWNSDTHTIEINEIFAIEGKDAPTHYYSGQEFNRNTIKVSVYNASKAQYEVTGDYKVEFDSSCPISYTDRIGYAKIFRDGYERYIPVHIERSVPKEIDIATTGRTEFVVNTDFDISGLSVKVIYNSGEVKCISIGEYGLSYTTPSMKQPGVQTVTISYDHDSNSETAALTCSYDIHIVSEQTIAIKIITLPRTVYDQGDSFDKEELLEDISIVAIKDSGMDQKLDATELSKVTFSVSPSLCYAGTSIVTVKYSGLTTTYSITVNASDNFDHEWNDGIVTTAPTHTASGVKTYTCTVDNCGAIKTEEIGPTKEHTYGNWQKLNDTQHQRACECGELEYADHDLNEGTITVAPTYTSTGEMLYVCKDCDATIIKVIPVLEIPQNAPYIVVESKNAIVGKSVTVKINLKNNPGITSMRVNVAYDSALLTLTDVEYNAAMGGQSVLPENIKTLNGNIVLYWADGFANYEGEDVFATLTFTVSDNAVADTTTTIAVTYDAEDIYDADESNVTFFCDEGVITFIDYTPGDINGDGVLNSKDTTRLMRYLAGWDVEVNEAALDVNGDGVVNTKDTTRLMRYLAGWDVEIY